MNDPLTMISTRRTPQAEQARPDQVQNSAGGWGFQVSREARLHRFLTLGTSSGTYYSTEKALTQENAQVVLDWARSDAVGLVNRAVEVSRAGRAPRNNPALFALAAAAGLGDDAGRRTALGLLPQVARTGTHLFTFAGYVEQFRGWGRGLRRGIGNWYLGTDLPGSLAEQDISPEDADRIAVSRLAYQVLKYRNREGWTHRDLLRLAHPKTASPARNALFGWILGQDVPVQDLPRLVQAFEAAQAIGKISPVSARSLDIEMVNLIAANPGLSWEMLPDEALSSPAVWEALIAAGMPQTALMRQLPRLTRLGVLTQLSAATATACAQLADREHLISARVHPVNVLVALRTYASGRSVRGSTSWTPVPAVTDALDAAFYAAFGAVEPSGKRIMEALDVSGSMTQAAGGLPVSCREATAAMALVTAATEPQTLVTGFTSTTGRSGYLRWPVPGGTVHPVMTDDGITPLGISPRQRLDDAIRTVSNLPFGGTDCALPMLWAARNNVEIDTFRVHCVDTDTEILTADGWCRYDHIRAGDEVYTLDHATGLGEWQQTAAVSVFPAAPRRMLKMEGRGHSSLTTLNHRWPVRHRGNSQWGRRWRTSETLNQVDYIQCATADSGLPAEPKFSDAFVELMAWIWTEGHVDASRGIRIAQSLTAHPEYCDRIDSALRRYLGPPVTGDMRRLHAAKHRFTEGATWKRYPSRENGYTAWALNQVASAPLLEWMTIPEKVVSCQFLRSLTRAQLELYIQASIDGDGWRLSGGTLRLSQHSRARAEAFQFACTLAGYATSIACIHGRQQWEVGVLRRTQFAPLQHAVNRDERSFTVEQVIHDGPVWCPTTPNGTWLARRNGTVYWTGNTDNETWAGDIHPHQALEAYRQKTGIDARLAVIGMTATEFTIADPEDPGTLDVSGLDAAVPALLADFSRGDI